MKMSCSMVGRVALSMIFRHNIMQSIMYNYECNLFAITKQGDWLRAFIPGRCHSASWRNCTVLRYGALRRPGVQSVTG